MTTQSRNDLVTHPNLMNAQEYIQHNMVDPDFRSAFEDEGLRIQIAEAIRSNRKALNLSQEKLAQRANTTQKVISRIEQGEVSIGVDLLQRIAHALKLRINLLFG
ncbi:helix-turn-helix domain-containing protein [Magnetococcales bacterium HHB-1]